MSIYVLASRSPRRLELLRQIVPAEQIRVMPPLSAEEAGFDGLTDRRAIEDRLLAIARTKCADVVGQLRANAPAMSERAGVFVIAGDTVIVAQDEHGRPVVLGQPPKPGWQTATAAWFRRYYAGRTHEVWTGLRVERLGGEAFEQTIRTEVAFTADVEQWLDWYIATGEPQGKAGGYAIQGAGSVFVESVRGSLTNVVGLPLRELLDALRELEALDPSHSGSL